MVTVLERGIRDWKAVAPWIADLLLAFVATVLAVGGLLGPALRQNAAIPWYAVLFAILSSAPVIARRRQPFLVLGLVEAGEALYLATAPLYAGKIALGLAVALYTVVTRSDRHTSLLIAGSITAINALALLIGVPFGRTDVAGDLFGTTVLTIASWSVGENIRTRRAYLAQLEERARRLEAEREENAQRAVRDERTRIARELHDVVAHHVSAIAVQAAAAAEIVERNPQRAREALGFIQETSRQALAEMRAMLNVLRSTDETAAAREPQPSLAQIERLVSQSRAAGLPVTLHVEGTVRPLPEALDLSAYRIVQEALTNSLKHAGPAHASVLVRYMDDTLELDISDDGQGLHGQADGVGEGRGLIGMRERVALFGGELVAGALPGHGFRVQARLPLRQP
jgi:signal transduction histidine kinase